MIVKDCYATLTFRDGSEEMIFAKGGVTSYSFQHWGDREPMLNPYHGRDSIRESLNHDWIYVRDDDMRRTSDIVRVQFREVERDVEPATKAVLT